MSSNRSRTRYTTRFDGRRLASASRLMSAASCRGDGDARIRGTRGELRRACVWSLLAIALPFLPAAVSEAQHSPTETDPYVSARRDMVETQVRRRGIRQSSLLSALEDVPRHRFVPQSVEPLVYRDAPVSFAPGQNLSQVYLSARMISLLGLKGDEKVLEIGTGSGYDAALLSRLAKEVYTVEIDDELGAKARSKLAELGYDNVEVRIGDGYRGWPEKAPFDAILLTAAPQRVPEPLFEQLKIGGRMVVAVGYSLHQDLKVITRTGETEREIKRVNLISLTPMTGEAQDGAPPSRY